MEINEAASGHLLRLFFSSHLRHKGHRLTVASFTLFSWSFQMFHTFVRGSRKHPTESSVAYYWTCMPGSDTISLLSTALSLHLKPPPPLQDSSRMGQMLLSRHGIPSKPGNPCEGSPSVGSRWHSHVSIAFQSEGSDTHPWDRGWVLMCSTSSRSHWCPEESRLEVSP